MKFNTSVFIDFFNSGYPVASFDKSRNGFGSAFLLSVLINRSHHYIFIVTPFNSLLLTSLDKFPRSDVVAPSWSPPYQS